MYKKVILTNVKCIHEVSVPGPYNKTCHVYVFMDEAHNTYAWATATYGTGIEQDGIYDLQANLDEESKRLSYVKKLNLRSKTKTKSAHGAKSEQPDAYNIILGLDKAQFMLYN